MRKPNSLLTYTQKLLIFVIPVLYFIAAAYFRNLLGNLSLRSCDPEYIYFMSGLTLSDGTLKLGHIDNPGTPLQVLIAMVFKITYSLRATQVPYVEDVFLHPDLYLSLVSLVIAAFTTGLILFAGHKVFRHTRSVLYALLVQTAPFLPVIWYDLIGRVTPELMMPFPIIILLVVSIQYWYDKKTVPKKTILILALITGFGLSVKLTYLPLSIIPFFMIESWKRRFTFLGLSLLSFLIFAFPVTLQIEIFWSWIKNLFLHSGTYGCGKSDIVELATLKTNLTQLFYLEKSYFYLFFSLILALLTYSVYFRKKAEKKVVMFILGIIFTIAIQLLMVGKHYAHRYFIPVLMLSPLMVFVIVEIIKKTIPSRINKYIVNVGIVLILVLNIQQQRQWLPVKTRAMGTDIENRISTWHFASLLEKDSYRIITSQNYGSPFIEYTLMYSMAWANNKKKTEYTPILDKLYPNTYNYFTWDNSLRFWGKNFDVKNVIESGKNVYLYLERNEEELFKKTIEKLKEVDPTLFHVERKKIYLNPKTNEVIFSLKFELTKLSDTLN